MYESEEIERITTDFITMLYEGQDYVMTEDKSSEGDEDDTEFDKIISEEIQI